MKALTLFTLVAVLASCDIIVLDSEINDLNLMNGGYQVKEYSHTYNQYFQYTIWIKAVGNGSNIIYLDNFYDQDLTVRAEVIGHKLFVHKQCVDGYEIEGVGTFWRSEIRVSYSISDMYSNQPTDYCDATIYR